MDRNERIVAAARRVAKLQVDATRLAAQAAMAEVNRRNLLNSSICVENVARTCETGYREICRTSAIAVAEIEGELAPHHAVRLGEILREYQAQVLGIYQQRASRSGIKQRVDTRRADLQKVLDEILKGTIDDFEIGIAGGVNVKKQKAVVSIDNRGGTGQFAVYSPHASQAVGYDQMSSGTIDLAALLDLLRQIRDEVAERGVASDTRVKIEDAILNVEREAQLPAPDRNRVFRLLRAVGTRAEQFGISIAANLVTAYLETKGLSLNGG